MNRQLQSYGQHFEFRAADRHRGRHVGAFLALTPVLLATAGLLMQVLGIWQF